MGRPLKTAKLDGSVLKDLAIPGGAGNIGGVGGNTSIQGYQIQVRARITGFSEGDGFIVRQKGRKKFRVTVGANTGNCVLVDKTDGSLNEGEMTISFVDSGSTLARASRITNKFVHDFAGNRFLWSHSETDAGPPAVVQVESA